MGLGPHSIVLVTGAGGVLGGAVLAALRARGVRALPVARGADWEGRFAGEDVAAIVHCAFARTPDGSALAESIDFSRRVCAFAAAARAGLLVNISSQSVYGGTRQTASRETDAVAPVDAYAVAKYACEHLAEAVAAPAGVRVVHVRLASLIGPAYPERIVSKMVQAARENGVVRVFGGRQTFAFLNLRDAADGVACLVARGASCAGVYNLGTAESLTLLELARRVAARVEAATGRRVAVEVSPGADAFVRTVDVSRMRRELGWSASVPLDDSVDEIIASLTEREG